MEAQTLEQLKAENAEADDKSNEEVNDKSDAFMKTEEGGDNSNDDNEHESESKDLDKDGGEGESGEKTGEESESWMQSDEQGAQDGDKKFTDGDIANAKRKLKAKVGEQADELERLTAENLALKSRGVQQPTGRPKREAFENQDDPDVAYEDALYDWRLNNQTQTTQRAESSKQATEAINSGVDRHYEDAGKLIQEHDIDVEIYKAADQAFRQAIEAVLPKQGDAVADALIAKLGTGSAKATFFLGRNKAKLAEFQEVLRSDPTGIQAAMFMGEIKSSVSMPRKQARNIPNPPSQIQGDNVGKSETAQEKKLAKQYNEAQGKGFAQLAYNTKKTAKAAGIDVSKW